MQIAKEINVALENSSLASFIGKTVPITKLRAELNAVAHQVGGSVRVIPDKKLKNKRKKLRVAGEYWFNSQRKYPKIVRLEVAPQLKEIFISRKYLNRLVFLFSTTLQHEEIHRLQNLKKSGSMAKSVTVQHSDKIGKTRKEDIEYYSNGEEISPYAHDLALEICHYYSDRSINELLKNRSRYRNLDTLTRYFRTFKGTNWNKLKNNLLKKMYYWLPGIIPVYKF